MMYNPINMQIEDEQRLNDKDLREKNKKKRYEVRYDAEQVVRRECLAEQDRLDQMSLAKVSHMRVKEEIDRGFDIVTNGDLRGGLAKIEATSYMQKQPTAWQQLSPKAQQSEKVAAAEAGTTAAAPLIDFQSTAFDRRSKRLNTTLAKQGDANGPVADKFASAAAEASLPPKVPSVSGSQRSAIPPSQRSKVSGQASNAAPASASQRSTKSVTSSKRAIRTGGFQNIGQTIVH